MRHSAGRTLLHCKNVSSLDEKTFDDIFILGGGNDDEPLSVNDTAFSSTVTTESSGRFKFALHIA